VRWYVAYRISFRQLKEMMAERGVEVDHSTQNRWLVRYVPLLEKAFVARKRPVGDSWGLDEAYICALKGPSSICVRPGPSAWTAAFMLNEKQSTMGARGWHAGSGCPTS
jgi:putative transposase